MASLKELKSIWYEKLRESGFVDIEDERGRLKDFKGLRKVDFGRLDNDYYAMAMEFLAMGDFDNQEERKIWELFCDGKSIRKIESATGIYRFKVNKVLIKYQERAGLRRWKN